MWVKTCIPKRHVSFWLNGLSPHSHINNQTTISGLKTLNFFNAYVEMINSSTYNDLSTRLQSMKNKAFYFLTAVAYSSKFRIPGRDYDVVTDLVKGHTHSLCAMQNFLNLAINGTLKKVNNASESRADRLNEQTHNDAV
jgi:hypothetical protein